MEVKGVRIFGPLNLPSELSVHASEMYAKNLLNLSSLLMEKGEFAPKWEDEIIQGALLMKEGEILHGPTKALVGGA